MSKLHTVTIVGALSVEPLAGRPRRPALLAALLALALSACARAGETVPPTEVIPPATETPQPPAAAPTVAPTAVPPTEMPTEVPATRPSAAPSETHESTPASVRLGSALIRDNLALSDQLFVSLANLPPLQPGQVYAGWLLGYEGAIRRPLGAIPVSADGTAQLLYDAPSRENLLANYDGFLITIEPDQIPEIPGSAVVAWGQVSLNSMAHIRDLLVSFPDTPGQVGLVVGLRSQSTEVVRHTQYAVDAARLGDIESVRRHTEHVIALIEGPKGPNYRDLDGDGQILDPGDGFGMLDAEGQMGYVQGVAEKAKQAGEAAFATEATRLHSQHVQDAAASTKRWLAEVRDIGLTVFEDEEIASARARVEQMAVLAERALNGFDANSDEQIEPVPGEAGARLAYQHAQFLAEMPLEMQRATLELPRAADTPPPLPEPTSAPASSPPAPEAVTVTMAGFTYSPASTTIKAGTAVTFSNQDSAPHTATGDDGEFDTGILKSGESTQITFNRAGTFRFYCQFHGGPGEQGMAGTIVVEP